MIALALVASAAACGAALVACITAPPPDLPVIPLQGPHIVQDEVSPPPNTFLTALPADGVFIVPVQVEDETRTFEYRVYVDFFPGVDNITSATGLAMMGSVQPALDGGVTAVPFMLQSLRDPGACHTIQFIVADAFSSNSAHSTDSLGADSVTWFYTPSGPEGCTEYDAGDGAAPPDAPMDGFPLTPDAVGPI